MVDVIHGVSTVAEGNAFSAVTAFVTDKLHFAILCDIIWDTPSFLKGVIQAITLNETRKQFVH
jgi:hypothetical protein